MPLYGTQETVDWFKERVVELEKIIINQPEYTGIEKGTIEIVDKSLMTWNKPHIGDTKEKLIYKAECYFSTLKEIQSLFHGSGESTNE